MTLEQLRSFGCDVDAALRKYGNNESSYLNLVSLFVRTTDLSRLESALLRKNYDAALNEAKNLKNLTDDLSLRPLSMALDILVTQLNTKADMNYLVHFDLVKNVFNKLKSFL